MPPQGMFDIRYSSQRSAERLSTPQGIDMMGVQYPVTVKAEATSIILSDETGKEISRLNSGQQSEISASAGKLYITENLVPAVYSLEQNYPNPFNPSTMIQFSLPENSDNVKLSVFNALGQKVAELVSGSLAAGKYISMECPQFCTGIYMYELRTDHFVSVKKMMLLK